MRNDAHTFHIPVMGTGFTVDTPLRVARYGISSVISLVEDKLLEEVREYHARQAGEVFAAIPDGEEDCRARRITAYLNLVQRLVDKQVARLQASEFVAGGEIVRYFELLPDCPLKRDYQRMLAAEDPVERKRLQDGLRSRAVPGSIDVNIMTKLDRDVYINGRKQPAQAADAMSALRGFARSDLCSSIIFSAGLNPRLYGYLAEFPDFFPDRQGRLRKRIVIKVSDFRSAIIQGKYLARRGLWVSEFRIESGLNCGGHAFASEGFLLGPNLEEFRNRREELRAQLHEVYVRGLRKLGMPAPAAPQPLWVTVQGGIGTAAENEFLLRYYRVDGTGWATPFLLVPEVTNVDDEHLRRLLAASSADVRLSRSSPMGIRFWNLMSSASEDARRERIAAGKPGSPCRKGHLRFNTEFGGTPLCAGSHAYQKQKLARLDEDAPPPALRRVLRERILAKSCICHDLGGGVRIKLGIDEHATPAICPGPNIVNFKSVASLEEMIGHIYGRMSLLANSERPHMFIQELMLYIEYVEDEIRQMSNEASGRAQEYFQRFCDNLAAGVEYYRKLAERFSAGEKECFLAQLNALRHSIDKLFPQVECFGEHE